MFNTCWDGYTQNSPGVPAFGIEEICLAVGNENGWSGAGCWFGGGIWKNLIPHETQSLYYMGFSWHKSKSSFVLIRAQSPWKSVTV